LKIRNIRSAGQRPAADFAPVSPQYFGTLRIPLLEGRDFTERDDASSPQVMIVNQAFAQRYFPGEHVLGKKLKPGAVMGSPRGRPGEKLSAWWETSGFR